MKIADVVDFLSEETYENFISEVCGAIGTKIEELAKKLDIEIDYEDYEINGACESYIFLPKEKYNYTQAKFLETSIKQELKDFVKNVELAEEEKDNPYYTITFDLD